MFSKDHAETNIAILGAGMSGIAAAIQLKNAGFPNITLYEQSDAVGGVWRDNIYPGAACDVPSHLYSYSFEPKPDWPNKWSKQPEILRYLEHCVDAYDLRPLLKLNTQITGLNWDDTARHWRVSTASGEQATHNVIITALGQLSRPAPLAFEGLDTFAGDYFHSAQWRDDVQLDGKTVLVVGAGPSAAQLIPEIAPRVKRLISLQRTPAWVRDRGDTAYTTDAIRRFRANPLRLRLYRDWLFWKMDLGFAAFKADSKANGALKGLCLKQLKTQISDPDLRRKLTPDYAPGCKRVVVSDDYYPALARDNVDVVDAGLARVTSSGVVDAKGGEHACDVIIFATGFAAQDFLSSIHVTGVEGRRLADAWERGPVAHRGVAVADFPNFFMLYGPNTNFGHTSILISVEAQIRYVRQCLEKLEDDRLTAMQPKRAAQMAFNETLSLRNAKIVWAGDCDNWYKDDAGRVINNWPASARKFRSEMRSPNFSEYEFLRVVG